MFIFSIGYKSKSISTIHLCLLFTRWACLRSILRSQSLFRRRPNPSSFPALSLTQINERQPGTCSRICSCVKTSKAKRTRSLSNPQVTSLTKSNMLSTAVIIMRPGLTLLVISMVCEAFWVCERARIEHFSQANTQSCQTPSIAQHSCFSPLSGILATGPNCSQPADCSPD